MADRGYESFNTFAHLIRKGMYFVIRMKAFPVMLVHLFRRTGIGDQPLLAFTEARFLSLSLCQFLFLWHLRNLPDFLLMISGYAFSVLSAHGSKKAGL